MAIAWRWFIHLAQKGKDLGRLLGDLLNRLVYLSQGLAFILFFIGVVIFVFRPGSRKVHDETSSMIFRNEDKPAPKTDSAQAKEAR